MTYFGVAFKVLALAEVMVWNMNDKNGFLLLLFRSLVGNTVIKTFVWPIFLPTLNLREVYWALLTLDLQDAILLVAFALQVMDFSVLSVVLFLC